MENATKLAENVKRLKDLLDNGKTLLADAQRHLKNLDDHGLTSDSLVGHLIVVKENMHHVRKDFKKAKDAYNKAIGLS